MKFTLSSGKFEGQLPVDTSSAMVLLRTFIAFLLLYCTLFRQNYFEVATTVA
jgi:hypothetical protein